MIDALKPGQTVRCTLTKLPMAAGDRKTLERLMRRDPAVTRGLRKSAQSRLKATLVYNRGNRDWVQRKKCGKIVRLVPGSTWSFRYDLNIAPEMKSVADFLKIDAA